MGTATMSNQLQTHRYKNYEMRYNGNNKTCIINKSESRVKRQHCHLASDIYVTGIIKSYTI